MLNMKRQISGQLQKMIASITSVQWKEISCYSSCKNLKNCSMEHWVTGIVLRSRSNSKREHNHFMADRSQYQKKHVETLKKEIQRLCDLGVLKWQADSEWALPTFIVPKKDNTVRVVSDFREINKWIVRKPFPIPKNQHCSTRTRRLHICHSP